MENKKYRTFEIVDGKIKITNAISKFMRFVYGTCFFAIDSPKNSEEFMKRCEVIGYLFSGDYSKKKMNKLFVNLSNNISVVKNGQNKRKNKT